MSTSKFKAGFSVKPLSYDCFTRNTPKFHAVALSQRPDCIVDTYIISRSASVPSLKYSPPCLSVTGKLQFCSLPVMITRYQQCQIFGISLSSRSEELYITLPQQGSGSLVSVLVGRCREECCHKTGQ